MWLPVPAASRRETASSYLAAGLLMSLGICGLLFMPCYLYCDKIAAFFFHEPSCAPILRILIFAIPLECIHSCINGYYYGKQKANIPAFGQCIEQIVRVLCVYLIFCICQKENIPFRETHAALGLLLGEIAATIYFVTMISLERFSRPRLKTTVSAGRRLAVMSYPITLNRVSLNTLNGLENTFIPERLIAFGFSSTEALSVYGVFSGMAMPVILFPNVLSNSVSVMLLPMIAKAAGERRFSYISRTIRLAFFLCMLLGFGCSLGFFLLGNFVGDFLFGNELAGDFIRLLCWICPFLFLNATFSSILNGLGQTKATFLISMTRQSDKADLYLLFHPGSRISGICAGYPDQSGGNGLPLLPETDRISREAAINDEHGLFPRIRPDRKSLSQNLPGFLTDPLKRIVDGPSPNGSVYRAIAW